MSIQITGSLESLPWSCQVPFGARCFAALTLDVGVAALLGEDGAAGIGRVDVRGRDVARIVDRDRAADGVGDLQPAVQARIEQQDALPIGEFDRRHLGLARDLGNAVQVGAEFAPAPHVRQGLHLGDGHAPRRELPAPFATGLAEPGPLRRRIRLGANPDVVLSERSTFGDNGFPVCQE